MTTLEFSALVQKYQGLVYTVCHQLVPDEGDAQDLAQETFLAAWRAMDRCPPGSDPEQRVIDALSEETLTQMILNLREPYKTPCRLMLLEQHTAAEAARLCGRPQKTVEAQIYRAKKMLAEKIRQERRSEDGIVS